MELFGGSAGLWIHEASKSIRLRRRCRTRRVSTTFSAFGRSFPTPAKSSCSIAPGTGASWLRGWRGIASKQEWQRGYEEINQFERMLVADGVRIVKCFLHITPAEQVRRFKDRLTNPLKRWKLSYEDLRNRSRWTDYEVAIEDMIERTSTKSAPWHLIPTNDKPYGRLAAFTILIDRLGEGLRLEPRPLDPKIAEAVGKLFDFA